MFVLRWFEELFLSSKSPAHRYEPRHKRHFVRELFTSTQQVNGMPVPPLGTTPNFLEGLTPIDQILEEAEQHRDRMLAFDDECARRHEERMASYSYLETEDFNRKINEESVRDTHPPGVKPPWEDD